MKVNRWFGSLFLALTTACTTVPDIDIQYPFTQVQLEIAVLQSAICSSDSRAHVVTDLMVTPRYSADRSALGSLSLDSFDAWYANGNIEVSFYADGRLKGINSSATGQGSQVFSAVLAALAGRQELLEASADLTAACQYINSINGGKPVSVKSVGLFPGNYTGISLGRAYPVNFSRQNLNIDSNAMLAIFGPLPTGRIEIESVDPVCANSSSATAASVPDYLCGKQRSIIGQSKPYILLRQPALANIEVTAGNPANTLTASAHYPQLGRIYGMTFSKPPVFGSTKFELDISEEGLLSRLSYGSDSGAEGLITALGGLNEATEGQTAAERAAEIKSEADLIAQQQRLLTCVNDASACE
jgi:hypothetical protein